MRKTCMLWSSLLVFAALMVVSVHRDALAADFRPLIGYWQRTDGGYVIEIRKVAPDGTVEAGYYNPRPINVAQARASLFKGYIKVEVELSDRGYPGSTYTLLYDAERDALMGLYYQAVQKQNFDVMFMRATLQ